MSENEPVEPRDEGESPFFILRVREGLSDEEVVRAARQIAKYALRRGFELGSTLPVLTSDDELEEHYQETYPPRSRDSYIGKEHFWRAGEEVGLDRRISGGLFGRLAYPLMTKAKSWHADEIIEPTKVGLVIRDRKDVNVPQPPTGVNLTAGGRTNSQLLHIDRGGNNLPPQAIVIQVGGIIDLADNPTITAAIAGLSGVTFEHFTRFAGRLKVLVAEKPTTSH